MSFPASELQETTFLVAKHCVRSMAGLTPDYREAIIPLSA